MRLYLITCHTSSRIKFAYDMQCISFYHEVKMENLSDSKKEKRKKEQQSKGICYFGGLVMKHMHYQFIGLYHHFWLSGTVWNNHGKNLACAELNSG